MQHEDVFHAYKPLLFSIAYHMLGSVMDAEDCVQEAFLRWYKAGDNGETEAVRFPKAYLSTIVTRLCIDQMRSARVQRECYVGVWLPEPLVATDESRVTGMAELSEALSVAFLHLLEQLSPIERAIFLLRQVFDYEYGEIAAMVQKSEDNCRQIMRRARQHLGARRSLYYASREQQDTILHQFLRACTSGDMDGLLALLANDIVTYADSGGKDSFTLRVANINGRPGIVNYINHQPYAIITLEIVDGRIQEIDIVANPDKLRGVSALN